MDTSLAKLHITNGCKRQMSLDIFKDDINAVISSFTSQIFFFIDWAVIDMETLKKYCRKHCVDVQQAYTQVIIYLCSVLMQFNV